jgi:hemoglobin-like flavoprotein
MNIKRLLSSEKSFRLDRLAISCVTAALMLTRQPTRSLIFNFSRRMDAKRTDVINSFNSYKTIGITQNDKLIEALIAGHLVQNQYLMPVFDDLSNS